VLVVDDEPQVRELLHTQLAAHGYEVIGCASGQEALESIRGGKTEILVLDLILPDMDGVEIIARIKSQHDWRRLPIVVITGAEVDKARREILQGFAIPAFAKPWKQDDLVRCLEEAAVGKHYLRA
jgi:chemosensory pili system protein ChpA (sensor histidine kinase/response regulator)